MQKNRFAFAASLVLPVATLLAAASSQSAEGERPNPRLEAPQFPAGGSVGVAASPRPGKPTIWQAVSKGTLPDVRALLRSNPKLANAVDAVGNRPLNIAVYRADREMMKYLISKGADVNGVDGRGATPLHAAVAWDAAPKNRLAIVKYLVSQGADVQRRFTNGDTILHFAKDAQVAQYLIDNCAQVNVRNTSYGLTPLHKAMYWIREPLSAAQTQRLLQLIRVLIDNGADVQAKDKEGRPLLDDTQRIRSLKRRQQVTHLLQAGANQ